MNGEGKLSVRKFINASNMSIPAMYHLILERISRRELQRVPEQDLVMENPFRNEAFAEVGSENGLLSFLYFYNALQITPVIKTGDRVLDIACGPANQLALIARLNPEAHFVGLDASANMLEQAAITLAQAGVGNAELVFGDMSVLSGIADASMDCVICTMSLHHLPDLTALSKTLRAVRRVLKSDGGFYFVDFGRLKRLGTLRFFAENKRHLQSEFFTQDYLNSMRAAFSVNELADAVALMGLNYEKYVTSMASFMVVFKSKNRRVLDDTTRELLQEMYGQLPLAQRQSFQSFANWFRTGGFNLPCELL